MEVSLVGSVLRKHHRAVRLVCQLPLGLRSFVGVLRSWTLASDLPGAVADCCQVSNANPGKSFEQIGGSELGGNFMVLHGRQLAAMRGCKGGRFAATRRYFVSLFVEPRRTSGDQRLAVAKKPSRKSAGEVIPVTTSPVDYPSRYGGESRRRPHSYSDWSSPSHATCARRCGRSQWGQVNVVMSRGRPAKL